MDTIFKIREKTRDLHDALEKLDFLTSIVNQSISLNSYILSVEQLFYIHVAVEQELSLHQYLYSSIYPPSLFRSQKLCNDLKYFGKINYSQPILEVTKFVHYVRELSSNTPQYLLGCLYVLEGSKLGSSVLIQHLSNAFNLKVLPGNGLDYHFNDTKTLKKDWLKFCSFLENFSMRHNAQEQIIQSAYSTFLHFYNIYLALSNIEVAKYEAS